MNTELTTHTTPNSSLSVLGETQARIDIGGKIRAGIKVLIPRAQSEKTKAIYDAGVKAGKPFAEIDGELKKELNSEKSLLMPKNVPYFTVRRRDFKVPEVADAIMKQYGSHGEHGYQLYRFPVIFLTDGWISVMPHALRCFTRNDLAYWSQYASDGKRYCMMHDTVPIDERSKRAKRVFGGRATVTRPENDGICNPNTCLEYQNRQCNLSGEFVFYVPGAHGTSAISLSTNSFYSMQQAKQKLELVGFLTGGKISGMFDGKPIFFITKKLEEVSMIDPQTGKAKRVKQWLIVLEADIDMTKAFQQADAHRAVDHRHFLEFFGLAGAAPAAALEGPGPLDPDESGGDPDETGDAAAPGQPPGDTGDTAANETDAVLEWRQTVFQGVNTLGLNPQRFAAYGIGTWGDGWSSRLDTLQKAHETLQRAADDDEFLGSIKNYGAEANK